MKVQIRKGVWETNSSSVHTLCISDAGQENCRMTVAKDGYIHVDLDEYYGKDLRIFSSQEEKLKYICTWYYCFEGEDIETLEDSYRWKDFNQAFADYVNMHQGKKQNPIECKGVKIGKIMPRDYGCFFDHQTAPDGKWDDSNCVVSLYDVSQVVNFIFNKYLSLKTDCD